MLRDRFLAVIVGKQDSDSHCVLNEKSCSQAPAQLFVTGTIATYGKRWKACFSFLFFEKLVMKREQQIIQWKAGRGLGNDDRFRVRT